MAFSSTDRDAGVLPPGGGRWWRGWVAACAVGGAALFVSQLAEIPERSALRGYDNTFNYLWLRSAMVDGDWDFRNDLAQCNTLAPAARAAALGLPRTATGRVPDKYGVGWAVLALPAYLMADGIVAAGRGLGLWGWARDGWNPVYQVCLQLGQAALALLSLWLAARAVAAWLGTSRATAWRGVMAVWATSSLVYYQTVDLAMSHGAAFFSVALLAFALAEGRGRNIGRWRWLLAGAGWGLATTTRFECAVFGLLAGWALVEAARRKERLLVRVALFAAGAAPFVLLQMLAWHSVYGRWLVFSYGAEGEAFHWAHPAWAQSWFSAWHGLFYWHPFLLVAAAGLLGWAWRTRGVAAVLAAAFLLTSYLNAAWWCWWFGSSFGNRAYDAALLPLMAGAAWLLQQAKPRWRVVLWSAALVAACWNAYAVLLYRSAAIPRNAPVTWGQMVAAAARLPAALHFRGAAPSAGRAAGY